MKRRRNSAKAREIVLDTYARTSDRGQTTMQCHVCGYAIHPHRDQWHADHVIPHAIDGADTAENLRPICIPCHVEKSGADWSQIAKGRRLKNKHFGLSEKRSQWRRW